MEFFGTLVAPQKRLIVAKDRDGVELGRTEIPDPSSMADAVALFGSAQAVVKAAMATLDIQIQAKLRSRPKGTKAQRNSTWRD